MGCLAIIASIVLIAVTAVYFYVKKKYSYFKEHGVPHLKPTFPLGNLQGMGTKYHMFDVMMNAYNELKGKAKIGGFYNIFEPTYLVTDIEVLKAITVKDFNKFVNRGVFVNEENEPLTGHLFAIEDDRWRFIRNKLSPAFTSGKLKNMYSTISSLGNNLVKAIERKTKNGSVPVDAKNVASRFTVDIVSSVAFGMDADTLNDKHQELLDIFKEVFGADGPSAFYFFFLFAFPKLSKFLKLRQFSKKLSDFFINIVGKNIEYREDNNDNRSDFLNMLIQLKNKGSIDGEFSTETRKLTLNECLAQAFLFFFAGSDTSSTTISFALTELAFNQDVQDRLRDEILEKTKDSNGEITYETLHEMHYLNQVVNETLRMYTPGFANIRQANEDYKVPNTNITMAKGSTIFIPTIGFHYDEKYWTNPMKFDPERFTQEEIAKRPPQCYFPFGEGPRNCIGMRFGLLNVKYGVAMIIKNYKVTPDASMKYPIKMDPKNPQLEPAGGFMLNFEKVFSLITFVVWCCFLITKMLTLVISIILSILTAIFLFVKKKYSFFEDNGIPYVKPSFPLGNMQGIGSKFHMCEIIQKVYEECKEKGKIVGFYNLIQPIYLVTDLETFKIVTVKNFNTFVNRGIFNNEEYEPLAAHLFSIEDDRWRFIRNKISPAFTSGKLKFMYPTISDMAKNFVSAVDRKSKNGNPLAVKDLSTRFTVDIISSVAFGMEANTLNDEHQELINIFREVTGIEGNSMFFFFFVMAFPNLAKVLKLRQFSKGLSDFFMNVVGGNIKYREDNNDNRNDFLNMLIQLKNKGSIDGEFSTETKKLTLNEVLAQCFLFFLAGSDTSSTAISFALSQLAFNEDMQDRLRVEIMEKTNDTDGDISYETLHEMTYLNQVVNETLRMYTAGFTLLRQSNEDFIVPDTNVTIKKGSNVWIPTLAFHFDERFWVNPTKFDPERFTQEEIAKRPPQCYFPFGEGPRNCIGMRFGLVNVKLGIAMIIKNFKITPDSKMEYPIKLNPKAPGIDPLDGFWLNFEKI
ncbi:uncharacterized protein [Chironomus tepperi]|uniref:uncharacterized protein n=1 Tax=Chironomus tepperi TaxID=113505 RepID=UPI00391F6325